MSVSRLGLSEHGNGLFQASASSVMLIRLSFIHLSFTDFFLVLYDCLGIIPLNKSSVPRPE